MTISSEQVQEIYEAAVHEEATGDEDASFDLLCKLDDAGGTGATIRKLIDMVRARDVDLLAVREAQSEPVSFDTLADAVKEVTGGIRIEFSKNTDKGHHAVPFMNFNSLSRIAQMFRAAPPAPAVPEGYKLVPVEPTENMVIDGFESEAFEALADAVQDEKGWPYSCRESAECVTGIFKAMLAAAPKAD